MRRARLLTIGFALAALLAGVGRAAASGYHPDFDTAVDEAPWILLHTVARDVSPAAALSDLPRDARGRAYYVKVKRCFRGPFRPGDELIVWDPWYQSTAGYYLDTSGENLSFLAPPGSDRRYRVRPASGGRPAEYRTHPTYGGTARSRVAGLRVGVVFRNLGGGPSRGRGAGLQAWVRLLELTRVGARPLDLGQVRAILRGSTDPVLHAYALTHWPGPVSAADGPRVRAALLAHLADPAVTTAALALLRRSRIALGPTELRRVLEAASPYTRDASLVDVGPANVDGVKDVLWSWIQKDDAGALGAVAVLARLATAYLRQQVRAIRLPFWLDIPALNALRIRPEDVGRPPYPVKIALLNPWELHGVGRLVKGETFSGMYPMSRRDESWAAYFPLLVPHLPRMTAEAREIAVAYMRSLGFEVRRTGTSAVLGPRTSVPLDLQLEWVPGQPGKIRVTERALRPVLLCDTTVRRVELYAAGSMIRSVDGILGSFSTTAAPQQCFRWVTGVVRSELVDVTAELAAATGPGPHHLEVALLHARSGAEHGLDAWTGLVVSPRLALPPGRPATR